MSRDMISPAVATLLAKERVKVMAVIPIKGGVFVSARWPEDAPLFGGKYRAVEAASVEEAVMEYLGWLWGGL